MSHSHQQKRSRFCLVLWIISQRIFKNKRWQRYLRIRKIFNLNVDKAFGEYIAKLEFNIKRKHMKDTRIVVPNSNYGRKNTWT